MRAESVKGITNETMDSLRNTTKVICMCGVSAFKGPAQY
jgi:hypothetical protein